MPLRPSSWYEEKRTNENIYFIGRLPDAGTNNA